MCAHEAAVSAGFCFGSCWFVVLFSGKALCFNSSQWISVEITENLRSDTDP